MSGRIPTSKSCASSESPGVGIGDHGQRPLPLAHEFPLLLFDRVFLKGEFRVEMEVMFILSRASHAILKSVDMVCFAGREVSSLKALFATIVTASVSSVSSHNKSS